MNKRTSNYVQTEFGGKSIVTEGFQWLLNLAKNDPKKKSALLAVPILSNLDYDITSVLGKILVKKLVAGNRITLNSILELSLLIERRPLYSWNGPILAIFPSKKLLDIIDRMSNVTDVLVIPWLLKNVQDWIDTWSAIPLGSTVSSKPLLNIDPILEVALESLTRRVNLSTGVTNQSDRDAAISLFRILYEDGIPFDPENVRKWLVTIGRWNPKDADEVQKIASGVIAGKQFRVKIFGWNNNILESWKERAKNKMGGGV
jgi:hypothetical protein